MASHRHAQDELTDVARCGNAPASRTRVPAYVPSSSCRRRTCSPRPRPSRRGRWRESSGLGPWRIAGHERQRNVSWQRARGKRHVDPEKFDAERARVGLPITLKRLLTPFQCVKRELALPAQREEGDDHAEQRANGRSADFHVHMASGIDRSSDPRSATHTSRRQG